MSIHVMNQVWRRAQFAGGELLVLLALADWADDDGLCWPKIPAIAEKSRLSERQVYRVIAAFEEGEILQKTTGRGRGKGNRYRINPDKMSGFKMAAKPVLHVTISEPENLTPASQKPDMGVKTPTPPNRKNHQEPSIKNRTPLPPLQASGECVTRVMRECGWVNPRLEPVIAAAIRQWVSGEESEASLGERMVRQWWAMTRASGAGLLRYPLSPRKFVAEGHWLGDARWPYDPRKLEQASGAAVGAFRGG